MRAELVKTVIVGLLLGVMGTAAIPGGRHDLNWWAFIIAANILYWGFINRRGK